MFRFTLCTITSPTCAALRARRTVLFGFWAVLELMLASIQLVNKDASSVLPSCLHPRSHDQIKPRLLRRLSDTMYTNAMMFQQPNLPLHCYATLSAALGHSQRVSGSQLYNASSTRMPSQSLPNPSSPAPTTKSTTECSTAFLTHCLQTQ